MPKTVEPDRNIIGIIAYLPLMTVPQGRRTDRNIILLGVVSLLNDISSEMIQPILPMFIASLGGGSVAIGLIGGLSDGIPSIIKIFAGYWSDRLGKRKPMIIAGYGISAAAKLFLSFSATWQGIFILKGAERLGKGIRSAPRDAMISESATIESRGRGFGLHRAMDTSGAIIGSALAYLLWRYGMDFRMILLVAGVFSIVALAPFISVKESFRSPGARIDLKLSSLSPDLMKFIVIASVFALGNFSYMFFILRAQEFFIGAMAIGAPLLLYIFFNVIYGALAMPIGIWSDRVGRKNVLTIGYAVFAATCLGFAYVSSAAGLIVLFALYGLMFALVDASERAFVSDLSCAAVRCTSLGIYYGAIGISAIISGAIAGELWQRTSPGMAFLFGAAASTLAATMLWRMKNTHQKQ